MVESKKTSDGKDRYRLTLAGLKPDDERPKLVVTATDKDRKTLHVADVDDQGGFDLPEKVIKGAHRITVGPKTDREDAAAAQDVLKYRPADFIRLAEAGPINVSRLLWEKWFYFIRCVSGRVRLMK